MYPYLNKPYLHNGDGIFLIIVGTFGNTKRALVVSRRDGLYGFPGGKREGSENFLEALRRECMEEIGLNIDRLGAPIRWLCSNRITNHFGSHAYTVEVSEEVFMEVYHTASAHIASTKFSELSGVASAAIFDVTPTPFTNAMVTMGAATVYEELIHLVHNTYMEGVEHDSTEGFVY